MKRILVTGASRGIGEAIVKKLRGQGHLVIGMASSLNWGDGPDAPHQVRANFEDPTSIAPAFERAVMRADGPLDVLINNAGINEKISIEGVQSLEAYHARCKRMLQVNLHAAMDMTYCFVKHVLAGNRTLDEGETIGRVVNITSRVARKPDPLETHYSVSKAGLQKFTADMAAAHAPDKIGFFSVAPGWVDTDMAKTPLEEMIKDIPTGRIATVQEVAIPVSFFVNDATIQMTNACIDVNGGSWNH